VFIERLTARLPIMELPAIQFLSNEGSL
jgi:hypothetical protein